MYNRYESMDTELYTLPPSQLVFSFCYYYYYFLFFYSNQPFFFISGSEAMYADLGHFSQLSIKVI